MKQYLGDILSKIGKFSKRLDSEAVLLKQHWIVLDDEKNAKKVYIFRKDGNLLISINGDVTKARWELLDFGNILIENNSNSYLFNHGFLDDEVLILKKDNSIEFFTLVSNVLYLDGVDNLLTLKDYLAVKYIDNKGITVKESTQKQIGISHKTEISTYKETLLDGSQILIENSLPSGPQINCKVFDTSMRPMQDGNYTLNTNRKIAVKDGQITSLSFVVIYYVKEKGEILIDQQDINSPQVGDKVVLNGDSNIDGEFKISWLEKIYVKDGVIVKRKLLGL